MRLSLFEPVPFFVVFFCWNPHDTDLFSFLWPDTISFRGPCYEREKDKFGPRVTALSTRRGRSITGVPKTFEAVALVQLLPIKATSLAHKAAIPIKAGTAAF